MPMLPERISNDLCSLREKEARPCLAVRMVFDADGNKRSHAFVRGLMRSAAKLAYEEAQAAIDGRPNDKTGPLLEPVLKPLWAAYAALSKARDARGPLDLDLPERKILVGADGRVAQIYMPERLAAHRLIEEFMIQANVAAAETLEAKTHAARLSHPRRAEPREARGPARRFSATLDLSLAKGQVLRPEQFNRILAETRGRDVADLVSEVVLRSQSQAEYDAGQHRPFRAQPAALRAFHLADPPLCRSHRASRADPGAGSRRRRPRGPRGRAAGGGRDRDQPGRAARHGGRARDRRPADRDAFGRPDRQGFPARVSGVTKSGLFIRLDETGADGFIPISTLGAEYFHYDEAARALVGERSGPGVPARRPRRGAPRRGRALGRRAALRDAERAQPPSRDRQRPQARQARHAAGAGRGR